MNDGTKGGRRAVAGTVAFVFAALIATGCCGGGEDACKATLTYKGITGPGAGVTKAEAQKGACWKYCIHHDPSVDAEYKRWLAANKSKTGNKTWDLDEVPALKMVRLACEDACQRDIAGGKAKISFESSCKK
ncbi:MAG TPA: hypothetical protein PLI95_09890 [Polyangiaceae bacterium]|nr:hypothetical protein [Polyangiaceae bacterium]